MKISRVMSSVVVEHLSGDTTPSPRWAQSSGTGWNFLSCALEMREEPMGHSSAMPQARQEEGWGRKIRGGEKK